MIIVEFDFKPVLITGTPKPKKKEPAPITDLNQKMLVNTPDLMRMLSLGRPSATKLGEEAGAKVYFGRKVMWSVERVRQYIGSMTDTQLSVLLRRECSGNAPAGRCRHQ